MDRVLKRERAVRRRKYIRDYFKGSGWCKNIIGFISTAFLIAFVFHVSAEGLKQVFLQIGFLFDFLSVAEFESVFPETLGDYKQKVLMFYTDSILSTLGIGIILAYLIRVEVPFNKILRAEKEG